MFQEIGGSLTLRTGNEGNVLPRWTIYNPTFKQFTECLRIETT